MTDLFGLREHDLRHEDAERHIRTLYEEMARLAIDIGALRADLASLARTVEGKVTAADVDPAITGLDASLADARSQLADAQDASQEAWSSTYGQLGASIDEVRRGIDAAAAAYAADTATDDDSRG